MHIKIYLRFITTIVEGIHGLSRWSQSGSGNILDTWRMTKSEIDVNGSVFQREWWLSIDTGVVQMSRKHENVGSQALKEEAKEEQLHCKKA